MTSSGAKFRAAMIPKGESSQWGKNFYRAADGNQQKKSKLVSNIFLSRYIKLRLLTDYRAITD